MTPEAVVALFLAAAVGGGLNAVAGGGSFVSFPALLLAGVPAIPANATNTVAMWPAGLASTLAYRDRLVLERALWLPLSLASVAGGVLGAVLLLLTPPATFERLVPFLLLAATLLFAFGGPASARLRSRWPGFSLEGGGGWGRFWLTAVQLAIATYGGYFSGGIGILMLAALTFAGMRDIHATNGLKAWLGACINGASVATFVVAGTVAWLPAAVMVAGGLVGGYGGAYVAQRLRPGLVRGFVILVGLGMTAYFFARW